MAPRSYVDAELVEAEAFDVADDADRGQHLVGLDDLVALRWS